MPLYDRTGPYEQGPRTGTMQRGYCAPTIGGLSENGEPVGEPGGEPSGVELPPLPNDTVFMGAVVVGTVILVGVGIIALLNAAKPGASI